MNWLRLYTEVLHDPKVLRLPDRLFRFWIYCLCFTQENHGVLPAEQDLALSLRIPDAKVRQSIKALLDGGLLERYGDSFQPHNWDGRQAPSDDTTQRSARYRQRVRATGATLGGYLKHKALVFARDNHACVYCRASDKLCLDHAVPILQGGDDDPLNLVAACKSCNAKKGGRRPEEAGMVFVTAAARDRYALNVARIRKSVTPVTVTDPVTDLPAVQPVAVIAFTAPSPSYVMDEPFMLFMTEVALTLTPLIDVDYLDAHREWALMDMPERMLAVANFREKRVAGLFADPALVCRPFRWLKRKEFNRRTVTTNGTGQLSKTDQVKQLAQRRYERDGEL